MLNDVRVSKTLYEKFHSLFVDETGDREHVGLLTGWLKEDCISCIGCTAVNKYFPTGLQIVGAFIYENSPVATEKALPQKIQTVLSENSDLLNNGNGVILFVSQFLPDADVSLEAKIYSYACCSIGETIPCRVVDVILKDELLLRARGEIELTFEVLENNADIQERQVTVAIERLQNSFNNYASVFHLKGSSLLVHDGADDSENNLVCSTLINYLENGENLQKSKTHRKGSSQFSEKVLNFEILRQMTSEEESFSPVIHYQRKNSQNVIIPLFLDVVAIIQQSMTYTEMVELLVNSITCQLNQMKICLLRHQEGSKYCIPTPYHFWPPGMEYPVTVVYPFGTADNQLETLRREIHHQLFLPTDRPLLRVANKHRFPDEVSDSYLRNPHIGVPQSGVYDGKQALVWGMYSYHHYMQDRIDDNGWGCAYRSLQTIHSWFLLQGYTSKPVPTHKQIQQALVDIGDKPPNFVNSRQWIGSQEVSYCLDHFIGVTSKIMCVSTGAELLNKGRELSSHFLSQGTPVMIGGGMLAHTILGIDFNEITGELKFLVLDPHYTGPEDISIIHNKGWCGWKDITFWNSSVFYNLCLPQRPIEL